MRWILAAAVVVLAAGGAAAEDISGSADHPLIPRYEGADIVAYETEAFTDRRFMVAPATTSGGIDRNLDATQLLEGGLTRITYRAPAERSPLEVFRNYEEALAAAGFATIFSCAREECGGRNFNHAVTPTHQYMAFGEYQAEQRYLAARLQRAEGDVYAVLYVVLNRAGGGPNMDRV